jgi:hypothetical protein
MAAFCLGGFCGIADHYFQFIAEARSGGKHMG